MLRRINLSRIAAAAAVFMLAANVWAQAPASTDKTHIWPDQWGKLKRISVQPITVSDKPVWDELGLEVAESAQFAGADGKMTGEAYRLADSTAALCAFYWLRPADSKPSTYAKLAVETPNSVMIAFGNYLLEFEGRKPTPEELGEFYVYLPLLTKAALPTLIGMIPQQSMVPNSQRYILGPETLKKFAPQFQPSQVGFHLGAEGELAHYSIDGKDLELFVFDYPTPQISRQRAADFSKISGSMVKRSGPLVGVLLSPVDANAAEKLLSQLRYAANVTWDQAGQSNPAGSVASLLLAIFSLTGLLLLFCVGGGLIFAFLIIGRRRVFGRGVPEDPMIRLHLDDDR